MARVRFFTDEDIYGAVAPALRRFGFDAASRPEAGRLVKLTSRNCNGLRVRVGCSSRSMLLISPTFTRGGSYRDGITVESPFPNNGRLAIYYAA